MCVSCRKCLGHLKLGLSAKPQLSMDPFYVTQSNPAHRLADPTQPNGTMEQCCSQGQNPKTKDEAKARTLKAEAKAWTLETKTKIPHIVAAMMRLLAATWRTEYDIAAEAQRI